MEELQKINVRFPDILYKRMQALVKKAQELDPGYSVNSYVVGLVREDLDNRDSRVGGVEIKLSPRDKAAILASLEKWPEPNDALRKAFGKPSAAELAAKFGIKTGATLEEVEPRMDTESGFVPGSLGPDAGREPVVGASEYQTEDPSLSFIREFGREALIRGTKIRGWGKMSWEQRFDLAREQKDASGT